MSYSDFIEECRYETAAWTGEDCDQWDISDDDPSLSAEERNCP